MKPAYRSAFLMWMLGLAALFYLALTPRFQFGYATDDAYAVMAAQSLARGRFAVESQPGKPFLTDLLPGYPLLLAPWVRLAAPHWAILKLLPIIVTLGSGFLLWQLVSGSLGATAAGALTLLFLFNPMTVELSGSLLSESSFLFFILLDLWLFRRLMDRESKARAAGLGLLLGWTALLRPQGVLLALAMGIVLGFNRRRRSAGILVAVAIGLWAAILADNWLHVHHVSGYWSLWRSNHPAPTIAGALSWRSLVWMFRIFFTSNLMALPLEPASAAARGGEIVAAIFVLALAVLAWRSMRRGGKPGPIIFPVALIFAGFYAFIHWLWPVAMPRYFHPVMPLALLAIVAGSQALWHRGTWGRGGVILSGLLMAVLYGRQDAEAWAQARHPLPQCQLPMETLSWIRAHAPEDAVFFAFRMPSVYLYTGRQGWVWMPARDIDELRYLLLQHHVTHVLYEPLPVVFVHRTTGGDPGWTWEHSQAWLDSKPPGFERVFLNVSEQTEIFSVRPDATYVQAYDLYREALKSLQTGGPTAAARARLDRAIALEPAFSSALNAYGASLLIAGRDLPRAERYLRRAVRARPSFTLAWLNLARVEKRLGQLDEARSSLQQARKTAEAGGEADMLLPAIRAEMRP
ncbi:MAG TPA: tetratricopeptide repeat protein [Elusimicrobiota bacterium]|nr:tetratricopeptide repeat protein [Elusimicrobiota bacterium]